MEHRFNILSTIIRVLLPTIAGGLLVYYGASCIPELGITGTMQTLLIAGIFINASAFEFFIKKKTVKKASYAIAVTLLELLVLFIMAGYIHLFILPFSILMIMTISDIECMEVPTWTLVALPAACAAGLYLDDGAYIPYRLISAAVAFLIFLIVSRIYNNMLGGADIFMVTSFCLLFDYYTILLMVILGSSITLVYAIINIASTKAGKDKPFAYLPGLTMGLMIGILIEPIVVGILY